MSRTGESRVLLHDLFAGLLSEKSSRKKKSDANQSGAEATDNDATSSPVVDKPVSIDGTEGEKDPEDYLKFEYSVLGWLGASGMRAEHIGGNASYDIYVHGYSQGATGSIEPGEYEVKSFKQDGSLAMLGQEKARPVLSSEFIKGLVRIGSHFNNDSDKIFDEIDSINSGDRSKLRAQVSWFTSPAGGRAELPRYESYLGLELSRPVYDEIFDDNRVKASFESMVNKLIDGIYSAILDHDTGEAIQGKDQDSAPVQADVVSVYYKGQSGKEHLLGTTTRKKLRLKIRPALETPSKVPGSEAESLADTSSGNFKSLITLYSLLEDLKDSCKDTDMDVIKTDALKSVKAVFGVEKADSENVNIYLLKANELKVSSMTRGGRLVLAPKGKKGEGHRFQFLQKPPQQPETSGNSSSTSAEDTSGVQTSVFTVTEPTPEEAENGAVSEIKLDGKVIRNKRGRVSISWKEFREKFSPYWEKKGKKEWNDVLKDFGVNYSAVARPSTTDAVKLCFYALNSNEYEIVKKDKKDNKGKEKEKSSDQAALGEARGRNRTSRSEVSMGGVPGVTTPVGTDASGGKGGPGKRRGVKKSQSILDKNAATQGKSWGGAKRVNEASNTSISVGSYGYISNTSADYDGDGDSDGVPGGTNSVYRGGHGDLKHNAKQIGRHFCNAEVIDDTHELLQDLLSGKDLTPAQARRFKRSAYDN